MPKLGRNYWETEMKRKVGAKTIISLANGGGATLWIIWSCGDKHD
jgi:hypothetical protein